MADKPTGEHQTLVNCTEKIIAGLSSEPKTVGDSLHGKGLISTEVLREITEVQATKTDNARILYFSISEAVRHYPSKYFDFISVLRCNTLLYSDLLKVLEQTYNMYQEPKKDAENQCNVPTPKTNRGDSSLVRSSAEQVKWFEDRFYELRTSALTDVMDKNIPVACFRQTLTNLPNAISKENEEFVIEKYSIFKQAESVEDIFLHLNFYLSFLDFSLLEHIIEHFGSLSLQCKMKQYSMDMELFRAETSVADIIPHLSGRPEPPPHFARLKMKLNFDPQTCTLEYLEQHRKNFGSVCSLSKFALFLVELQEGSLVEIWLLPLNCVPILKDLIQEKNVTRVFLHLDILELSVNKECLYPFSTPEDAVDTRPVISHSEIISQTSFPEQSTSSSVLPPTHIHHDILSILPPLPDDTTLPENVILPSGDPPHVFPGSGGDELLILLPQVDSTTLVEDDLFDILESLSPVASKWKAIGTALRIKRSKLEEIERNHKAETSECLADAVTEYLHQCYDVQKHGEPIWQTIVKAVQHQAGGNNRALALSIAREHVAAHLSVSFAGEQSSQTTDDEGYTHLLEKLSQKLRSQLEVLHSLSVKCDEDEHLKSRNIKKALSDFIETTTQSKINPDGVRKVLAKMYGSDLLVDNDIYEWALNEVASTEKQSSKSAVEVLDIPEDKLPPLFCEDTVYHACLCSYATSTRTAANYRDFFSKDFPQHSLEEASLSRSQDKEDVDRYLIARQGKTFYVTFQSEPFLSEWMKKFSSFEEGIRIQSERIPLRFFVRLMHDGYRIIFAGFSFGGLLAMSVAAFLWKQPLLSVDLLQENVACISIGAPIINLSAVAEVMEEMPQFGNTVHSILLDSDPIPRLMTFLDPRCEEVCTEILLSTGQPNTLESLQAFQGMFTSQLARHLSVLQEMGLSKRTDVDAANALSTIKSLLCKVLPHLLARNYSKQITIGSVYSVVKDPIEGVVFSKLQKEELPLHTEFPTLPDIDQLSLEMFSKHNAETYNNSVFRSFIKKAPEPRPPLSELSVVKPSTKSIAFHRYGKEVSVTVNGDNLWFCYDIQVGPHKKKVLAKDTSQRSLQFNYDPEDESKMSSDIDHVKVTLCSHFCNPVKDGKVEVTHKVYRFSFRQEQLAKLTPSELIETAYMSALLEQHPHKRQKHFSHRFDTVRNFLAQIVSVVPVETIVHTIGHCDDQNIANKCTDLLIASQLEFPPSLLFLHGMTNAVGAQLYGAPKNIAQKEYLERLTSSDLVRKLPSSSKKQTAHKLYQQHIERSTGSEHPAGNIINREALYVQTAAGLFVGRASEKDSLLSAQRNFPNHPRLEQIAKLSYIRNELSIKSQSCGELDALSGLKLKVVYPTTSRNVFPSTKESQVKTPLDILSEGRRSLSWLAQQMVSSETTRADSKTLKEEQRQQLSQLYNSKMLSVVNEIRTNDLRMCTSLLGAFMEEQIRVPLVKSEFNTARALNTLLSATAVGVWAMFSLTLGDMDAVIKSIPSRSLLVQVKEYIKGIFKEKSASADKNYAGKLQFMVQGMDKTVSCNSHYVSYSLEHQLLELCKKLNISESTPLEMLVKDWDRLFKDDVLSLVVPTHRSLIASWMKWALMMHNLREELAKYTTVGVIGLVNSGKSLLVSTLFNIEVPVGTTAVKRTTVPFLYNLEGVIEGLDVIDFPGVDDRDDTIPDLCELLLALAQVVIFVVDYRKAHTQSAKQWLEMLEDKSVPVLVCLTYADKLYAEHMGKDGSYPEVRHIQQRVSEECLMIEEQLGRVPSHDVKFFSFSQDRDSVLNSPEGRARLKGAGVGSPQEVGDWLAQVFESQLDQDDVAKQLKTFVYREDTHEVA